MLDLILIIMLIVSLFKPDVLLSKELKQKANNEQKTILTKNLRKMYAILIALFESTALMRYTGVGIILAIIFIILFFVISVPAIKENSRIKKELNQT